MLQISGYYIDTGTSPSQSTSAINADSMQRNSKLAMERERFCFSSLCVWFLLRTLSMVKNASIYAYQVTDWIPGYQVHSEIPCFAMRTRVVLTLNNKAMRGFHNEQE